MPLLCFECPGHQKPTYRVLMNNHDARHSSIPTTSSMLGREECHVRSLFYNVMVARTISFIVEMKTLPRRAACFTGEIFSIYGSFIPVHALTFQSMDYVSDNNGELHIFRRFHQRTVSPRCHTLCWTSLEPT
jgi:hypothetical protein